MLSYRFISNASARRTTRALALVVGVATAACSDSSAPIHAPGTAVNVVPFADSVFEGDVIGLHAKVLDDAGAEVPVAPIDWAVSDTTLAKVTGADSLTLLRPGTVRITARSGSTSGTYDLAIGRLAVKRVDLSPGNLNLGRGDLVQLQARVVGQGERTIIGRPVVFSSNDSTVALVGSPQIPVGGPGFLIATGPGSTTIVASVDGVTGTAHVSVVIADTTLVLTQYNGAALPVLVASDSVTINGVKEFAEVYADSGTLVLSGLTQERYTLDVHYTQYRVTHTGDTVQREPRLQFRGQFDRGVVTTGAGGNLSMLSEFIGPHLEHSATIQSDGYLVHYQEPGDNFILDLRYRRTAP